VHSQLVEGDLPAKAKEKEKAATKLFELDVNKSASKKANQDGGGNRRSNWRGSGMWNRRARVRVKPSPVHI
jgi:hypothetical protein